ncbi:uncharacterized protein [Amphiura filiformis]|uniref:uncharacterized protein n=1 Tax=Amphiura filiformis TaxID=82378 RepID=UPI003B213B6D
MAREAPAGPLKVFLWASPRTVSTSFLKCMTYVPDTVAWHEPYLQIGKFSYQVEDPIFSKTYREFAEKHGGASEVAKIESGYDASDKDFDWLNEQLEGDFPGKKMVFVKDFASSILSESRHDKIPMGFRHTFLIRNPRKGVKSMIKLFTKAQIPEFLKNPNLTPDKIRPVRHLNELWKYVKAEGLEPRPVIVDIDELMENPKEMLEAYCKEIGIPFTEDLLTWPAGDDVMTEIWMVPKQTILTFRTENMHEGTFTSTGFHAAKAPTPIGDSSSAEEELMNQIPPDASQMLKGMVDREFPYYEELYAERLTLKK